MFSTDQSMSRQMPHWYRSLATIKNQALTCWPTCILTPPAFIIWSMVEGRVYASLGMRLESRVYASLGMRLESRVYASLGMRLAVVIVCLALYVLVFTDLCLFFSCS